MFVCYIYVWDIFFLIFFFLFLQAISFPQNEEHQENAWSAVYPMVLKLKEFYEFSISLGKFVSVCVCVFFFFFFFFFFLLLYALRIETPNHFPVFF